MKNLFVILSMLTFSLFCLPVPVKAQASELQQLILNVEKLIQLKQILQKMYDGYKILADGYEKVKAITSGNYSLHEIFLDGLWLVSPEVRKYGRITDIINNEVQLVKEYKACFKKIRESGTFSPEQLDYLGSVYDKVVAASLQGLDELTLVITAGNLRMSDDERIQAIDRIDGDMKDLLTFVRSFNRDNAINAAQRIKEKTQITTLDNLYNK
jgi:hypothetical protein